MKIIEEKINLKLTNVFGGDGFEYIDFIDEIKLSRKKTRVTVRKDIGVPITSEQDEKKSEKREIKVSTFKQDEQGKPLLRLGGSHGKFWGMLRECGYMMYEIGEMKSKAQVDRILKTVQISPDWVILDRNGTKMKRETLVQIMNTIGKSQIQLYFDVIPECTTTITLKYPDIFKEYIKKMITYAESMNCLNKRRSTITILN